MSTDNSKVLRYEGLASTARLVEPEPDAGARQGKVRSSMQEGLIEWLGR